MVKRDDSEKLVCVFCGADDIDLINQHDTVYYCFNCEKKVSRKELMFALTARMIGNKFFNDTHTDEGLRNTVRLIMPAVGMLLIYLNTGGTSPEFLEAAYDMVFNQTIENMENISNDPSD